jgi:hypothetical protein
MKNEYFPLYSEIPLLLLDEEILLAGKKKRDATAAPTQAYPRYIELFLKGLCSERYALIDARIAQFRLNSIIKDLPL